MMNRETDRPFVIAVAYRGRGLGIAVLRGHEVIEIIRKRLTAEKEVGATIARYVLETARDYGAKAILVERKSVVHKALWTTRTSGGRLFTIDLKDAKRLALGDEPCATQKQLFTRILKRYPKLRRLVAVHKSTGELGWNEARRTAPLLAVALGLAWHRLNLDKESEEHNSLS